MREYAPFLTFGNKPFRMLQLICLAEVTGGSTRRRYPKLSSKLACYNSTMNLDCLASGLQRAIVIPHGT